MEAGQRREQSFPAHSFEIPLCDLRVETKFNDVPRSVFCRCLVHFDFLKITRYLFLVKKKKQKQNEVPGYVIPSALAIMAEVDFFFGS